MNQAVPHSAGLPSGISSSSVTPSMTSLMALYTLENTVRDGHALRRSQ